jgi:mannose-6-phosphate isomerase-like protein (cupin superfamily)
MDPFTVRRVVTEVDAKGRSMWSSDGRPPSMVAAPDGTGVADVWALDAAPATPADGSDSLGEGFPLEPPPGGLTWRIIRLPAPDPRAPREQQFLAVPGREPTGGKRGMHATDTLDLMTVLDGRIELEVEDGSVRLGPGDTVVQRGTEHRWRVLDGAPCTYSVVMLRPDPGAAPWPAADLAPRPTPAPAGIGPRRVVTGLDGTGRSVVVTDGEAPGTFAFAGGAIGYAALWETGGGPVGSPRQGGDAVRPWMQLHPMGGGISFKHIVLPPAAAAARLAMTAPDVGNEMAVRVPGMRTTGHHDPDDPAIHRTDTIDLDVIVEGEIELALPDGGPVRLSAGDCIVQRGTWHKWRNVGDTPARFTAVMLAVPPTDD